MQNLTETIGKRIAMLREQGKIKQSELAEMLGVKPNIISYYENDVRTPSVDIVIQLANIFNVTTDYLLCVSNNKRYEDTATGEKLGLGDDAISFLKALTENAEKGDFSKDMLFALNAVFEYIGGMYSILEDIVSLYNLVNTVCDELRNENVDISEEKFNYNLNMAELKSYQLQKNYGEIIDNLVGFNGMWELYNDVVDSKLNNISEKNLLFNAIEESRGEKLMLKYYSKEGADSGNDTQEGK